MVAVEKPLSRIFKKTIGEIAACLCVNVNELVEGGYYRKWDKFRVITLGRQEGMTSSSHKEALYKPSGDSDAHPRWRTTVLSQVICRTPLKFCVLFYPCDVFYPFVEYETPCFCLE